MSTQIINSRRNFLKVTTAAGGGMLIGFNWMGCAPDKMPTEIAKAIPDQWFDINAFIKIGNTGLVTIMAPNPEIGQNVKTSMPMIIAEELDVDWADVVVEQAPFNSEWYTRQVAGGSQSIRQGWESLRKTGATVRKMLFDTAVEKWQANPTDCSISKGVVHHTDGRSIGYGELANDASQRGVPEEVAVKDPKDFTIIGKSQKNVDLEGILTGKPLFGLDYKREGMLYAVVLRPPAFGQSLVSFDDSTARQIAGVHDVIQFGDKIAVLANNTWSAMKGQKALTAEWKQSEKAEDSAYHTKTLLEHLERKTDQPMRVDGDVDKAFAEADQVVERVYEAPFLPHACMEPMNFFADVTDEKVDMIGPIQTPEWTEGRIAELLKRDKEEIIIHMTRMGGGFGRRLYGDFALEAAEISSLAKKPVQVIFSREDDMTAGTYRPASAYKFKVGIKNNEVTAYHLTEAFFNGNMFGEMHSNFPCGAIPNYRVDSHNVKSNITTGAWRAPYANFLASAEQSFIDELAEILNKDAVDFRLELLNKTKNNPVGASHNYEVDKFIGVIQLAAEKANWKNPKEGVYLGFSTYYSHNTYVAEVAEVELVNNNPKVKKIICAVDCGIVVNPIGATNQIEGGIIDGIGHAMYGDFNFEAGRSQSTNYHQYRMIRMAEAPEIEVHFVESYNDPTGLGEPTLPPAGGAIANAFSAAMKKRLYKQPYVKFNEVLG
jgi:isoquinoline 1-oxidoreductase beta subunit